MEVEDFLEMEMTTAQVAEVFNVHVSTVAVWRRNGRLYGRMPRGSRNKRSGLRFKLEAVLAFAKAADDDGYSEEQIRTWFAKNQPQSVLPAVDIRKDVLS